jgi:hypothetical protein
MKKFLLVLLLYIITTNWQVIYAWNYSSHALSGIIAYNLMDTESRNKVLDLIKYHPWYNEDFIDVMTDISKFWTQTEREQWIFAKISFWPDNTRGFKAETGNKYHHSTWHYIILSVFPNEDLKVQFGTTLPSNTALNFNETSEFERMNIIEALDYITEKFESEEIIKTDKAVLLCWLFHLVGDLHQPLHSSTMFTLRLFATGDRRGNSIRVGKYNLHSKWIWALEGEEEISKLVQFSNKINQEEKIKIYWNKC